MSTPHIIWTIEAVMVAWLFAMLYWTAVLARWGRRLSRLQTALCRQSEELERRYYPNGKPR